MLASVILFYAFIYLATSKVVPVSEFCAKANTAGGLIKRSYVYGAGCCGDTAFCINVKDTIGVDWDLLADTACIYLHTQGLDHYRVFIIRNTATSDTLINKKCS